VTKTAKVKHFWWVAKVTRIRQIEDGGRPPSSIIDKGPYCRNVLTSWHKIWHGNPHWPCEPYRTPTSWKPSIRYRVAPKLEPLGYRAALVAWPYDYLFT